MEGEVRKNLMRQTCAFIRSTRDGSPASTLFFRAYTRRIMLCISCFMLYSTTTHQRGSRVEVLCALRCELKSRNRTGQEGTCYQKGGTTCGILAY